MRPVAEISAARSNATLAQRAARLERLLEEVRSQLAGAEVAHFDETGGRVDGSLS